MKRSPLRKVSKKREKLNREYSKLRKEYLDAHPICQIWLDDNGWRQWTETPPSYYKDGHPSIPAIVLKMSYGAPWATECHHRRGRGRFLLDTSTWMALSFDMHRWVHNNPAQAYAKGYMLKR